MGAKHRHLRWVAYLCNLTDEKDNDILKISSPTRGEALSEAQEIVNPFKFSIEGVYRRRDFLRRYPEWIGLI